MAAGWQPADELEQSLPRATPRGEFHPANDVEQTLLGAIADGDADAVLKTLLLAEVVLPAPDDAPSDASPLSAEFAWRRYRMGEEVCVPVFTSALRCSEALGAVPTVLAEGLAVVCSWPGPEVTLALNPGTPIGASLPGAQVAELAAWAAEVGLVDVLLKAEAAGVGRAAPAPTHPLTRLQKLIPAEHVPHYLERGYDLVSGLVHRAGDVDLSDPVRLHAAVGLDHAGSPLISEEGGVHLLRWSAATGGPYPDWQAATDTPAPQIRVAGVRLPHGALLCRVDGAGEVVIGRYDADLPGWRVEDGGGR